MVDAAGAMARFADVPGGWAVRVDQGVLTLTPNGRRGTEPVARTVAWGVPGVVGVRVIERADRA